MAPASRFRAMGRRGAAMSWMRWARQTNAARDRAASDGRRGQARWAQSGLKLPSAIWFSRKAAWVRLVAFSLRMMLRI